MPVVAPRTYNPILNLIEAALIAYKAGPASYVTTQKERAKVEGNQIGLIEGICEGISSHITVQRLARYPMSSTVPVIDSWEVKKTVLGEIYRIYGEYETRREEIRTAAGLSREQIAEQRSLATRHYIESVQLIVDEWVAIGPQYAAAYEGKRREAVMRGDIRPEVSDKSWIAERIESARQEHSYLEELLRTAQSKDKD